MVDMSKLKKRSLGAPPSADEASENLTAPEIAPVTIQKETRKKTEKPAEEEVSRIDGRTLRKTDRTVPFGTKVTTEFDARLRFIAQRDKLKICEVLEIALDKYEAAR